MKMFQINEDDLQDLERILPRMSDALMCVLTPVLKTQIRVVQRILRDVRWNYCPPDEAEEIHDE